MMKPLFVGGPQFWQYNRQAPSASNLVAAYTRPRLSTVFKASDIVLAEMVLLAVRKTRKVERRIVDASENYD